MTTLEQCQTVIFQLPERSILYDWLHSIHGFYAPIHTYLSIFLCVIGTICNFCNIVVLTRRRMRTPVNMILTAMACCDTVVLFSNLIYTTHYTFVAFANCHPRHWSYGWAMFLISHAHLSLVGHSSSVWLSVMLALLRYLTLHNRGNVSNTQIALHHAYVAIAVVIAFVAIMNGPNFLTYKIIEMRLNETCETTDESVRYDPAYIPGVSDMALRAQCLLFRLAFWISGTVFKVIPCILLTFLVWLLMRILNDVKEKRNRLLQTACVTTKHGASIVSVRDERTDRTTRMLLIILFVFLITEMPQGIMAVLSGMFSEEFRRYIYNRMGDILDLLSLCNACTTFIIYCSMSSQFRNEFRQVFLPSSFVCFRTMARCDSNNRPKGSNISVTRNAENFSSNKSVALTAVTLNAYSIENCPGKNLSKRNNMLPTFSKSSSKSSNLANADAYTDKKDDDDLIRTDSDSCETILIV